MRPIPKGEKNVHLNLILDALAAGCAPFHFNPFIGAGLPIYVLATV